MMLEAENRRLKDTLRSGKEPPDSNTALRKKIIKLSQRNFFLEWEKKDLSDKLQISLRLARETKEKAASEQEKRLREANHALTEKVRGLEDSLLKRRSAIDTRITETVKENGRLHQQLIVLKNGFDESREQRNFVEETARWTTEESPEVVEEFKTGLTGCKRELQELKAHRLRMQQLHSEVQQQIASEAGSARLIRTSSATLPPVLKSLNPSYLSRLGGTATSPPPSSPTSLVFPSPSSKMPSAPQVMYMYSTAMLVYYMYMYIHDCILCCMIHKVYYRTYMHVHVHVHCTCTCTCICMYNICIKLCILNIYIHVHVHIQN